MGKPNFVPPYPKALKAAEQKMLDAESAIPCHQERIEKYQSKLAQLTEERDRLAADIEAQTADGLLDNEDDARSAFAEEAFLEHEIDRYTKAIARIESNTVLNELQAEFAAARKEAREHWELYWQSVQQANTDHIVTGMAEHLAAAVHAHALSVHGGIDDWLLDVLQPRIAELQEQMTLPKYPVDTEYPRTPAEIASAKAQEERSRELQNQMAVANAANGAKRNFESTLSSWRNKPQSKRGPMPNKKDFIT